ncbi:MAG TPA: DUF3093 family protein, partial [Actinoplanes sp.]|nr:DUF3093 family protein [Actinoplanes sp.]
MASEPASEPTLTAEGPPRAGAPAYTERLTVSWWMWPLALGFSTLLAMEVWLGGAGSRAWLPFAVLLPLTAGLLWWA